MLAFDSDAGMATVEAGMTLGELMRRVVPAGWLPAVLPGTRFVTVGGAIAADVHGRNHHLDGSFGAHVAAIRLRTPREALMVSPDNLPELFWATVGGMGLTGVILQATLRLLRIETALIRVQTQRTTDLDATMSIMASQDGRRYSAAWIDGLARGRSLGRGVVVSGDHATQDDVRRLGKTTPMAFGTARQLRVPGPHAASVARHCVRAMNEIVYRRAPTGPRETLQSLQAFFHTHDRVDLFSLFAPRGFLEYQFVVPFERVDVVKLVVERIARDRVEPFFAVLKRFGKRNPGALSFPSPGWMAAFDFPFSSALSNLFHDLDLLIAGAGGRIFLAKDACLRPDVLSTMYPDLASWRNIRAPHDPDHVMQSDLAARLSLL
jgi:decaprenylphospho-beta-D-ribofuranose 2-oxidase